MYGKAILIFSIVFVNIEPEMVVGEKTTNVIPRLVRSNKEELWQNKINQLNQLLNHETLSGKTGNLIPRLLRSKKVGLWQQRVNQFNTLLKHELLAENEGENYMNLFLKLLHDRTEVQNLVKEAAVDPDVNINTSDDITYLSPEQHFSLFDQNSKHIGIHHFTSICGAWGASVRLHIPIPVHNSILTYISPLEYEIT